MAITCHDWRHCMPAEAVPLLAAEAGEWRRDLGWNVETSWRIIEPARAAGALPGLVARDESGRILGWTWFLAHHGCLQVAALVADRAEVVRALVDGVMASTAALDSLGQVFSVRGNPPGLTAALESHGLACATYAYQIAPLTGAAQPVNRDGQALARTWQPGDLPALAALCARAYSDSEPVRAFALHGTDDEWRDYLHGLVVTDGCGTLLPDASLVLPGPDGTLVAAVVTSTIDHDVAHVSQVVVDPGMRGRGLARRLVKGAMDACAARGAHRMTLLVASDNWPARGLYAELGFVDHATFIVASSTQPRRSTSVALVAGGVSTRR